MESIVTKLRAIKRQLGLENLTLIHYSQFSSHLGNIQRVIKKLISIAYVNVRVT